MKPVATIFLTCAFVSISAGAAVAAPPTSEFTVYFPPRDDATRAITTELGNANMSVRVMAYYFTSAPIAKAVVEAKRRGVDVQVILDKSQRTQKYSSADFFARAGVPTFIDSSHGIMHNKVIVVDDEIVITGSFNFTKAAAESNAENLLVIRDRQIAKQYVANWSLHRQHSQQYFGK